MFVNALTMPGPDCKEECLNQMHEMLRSGVPESDVHQALIDRVRAVVSRR